jgi:hypothetical protein
MADKRISQLIERVDIANNDVLPIVASGATTTNKVTVSTLQDWMQENLDVGVTSVGLSMPSAFTVSNSPVTASGNISVTGAGTVSQYIRGDGTLADFPSSTGGGSSVSYYLNGSVSQGTIGGVAYLEMNKTPVLGSGTDFTINANGYIASFITDAGDPALLEIPGGNWNFETYFSASSGGGTPSFYVELYKVNSGGTATLIASNSTNPELIAFGTTTTSYFSSLAVPTTTLALTDRLAIRYYVTHSGRTITLHTEDNHLCQIITTFTTGLTALNGLTAQVQNFATGTSGSDFNISSSTSTHTFNLPTASSTNRGALSSADWITFNSKQNAGNYVTTDTTQTITGEKTFSGSSLRLAANGTADAVVLRNVSGTTGSDSGATTMGFNGSDNLFINTQSRGGFILSFNNSVSNRTYTLKDASGTLAFTSDIPSSIVTGTGNTNFVPKFTSGGLGIIGNSSIQDSGTTITLGNPTDVIGALGVTGALNGTSASFSDIVTNTSGGYRTSVQQGYILRNDANSVNLGGITRRSFWAGGTALDTQIFAETGYSIFLNPGGSTSIGLTLASTGAATFSSTARIEGQFLQVVNASAPSVYINNTAVQWRSYLPSNNYAFSDAVRDVLTLGYNGSPSFFQGCNVGIGTASPNRLTEIVGSSGATLGVSTSSSGSSILYGRLAMYSTAASNSYIEYGGEIRSYSGAGIDYSDLRFYTAGGSASTERMRITSGGVVVNQGGVYDTGTSNPWIARQGGNNRIIADATGYVYMPFLTSGSGIDDLGWWASSGSSWTYNGMLMRISSSARYKKNIRDLELDTSKIFDLRTISFENNELTATEDMTSFGLLAEDVAEKIPMLATYNEEGQPEGVQYKMLAVLLLEEMKKMRAEIDSLKTK